MAQSLKQVPTSNNLQYTLDAQYTAGGSVLTLNSTLTGIIQAPGTCVVDRIDSSGNKTPTKRTYYTFTGVSGVTLTGVSSYDGTDQTHNVGAIVEFVPDVKTIQSFYDALSQLIAPATGLLDTTKVADLTTSQTFTNKTLTSPVLNGSLSGTGVDTDGTLAANSDTVVSSQKAVNSVTQKGSNTYAADAGSTDDYAITLTPAPAAYTTGMVVKFKANTANTGAATLNVNSLGAKTIVKNYNTTLADNDIKAGQLVEVIYDGTNFQLISPVSNSSSSGKILQVASYSDTTAISTSSGTLVDMTSTTVSLTVSANSRLIIYFSGNVSNSTATTNRTWISLNVGGSTAFNTYSAFAKTDTGGNGGLASFVYRTSAQSAGNITVKIQWASIDAGTAWCSFKSLVVMEESA